MTDQTLANTVRALELLAASHTAHAAGQRTRALDLYDQAAAECGGDVVQALTGAMRIGEIPTPGTDDWDAYLAHQRNRLEATRDDVTDPT